MRPTIKRGLRPILWPHPRFLILGSLPGDASIAAQQYYAHPQNQFWRLLATVFDEPTCETYDAKCALLQRYHIAVWDVLAAAERPGSLDTAIRNGVPNDIASLLQQTPSIATIACNGQKAHALLRRHFAKDIAEHAYAIALLPSTSPAATQPLAQKVAAWRAALRPNTR